MNGDQNRTRDKPARSLERPHDSAGRSCRPLNAAVAAQSKAVHMADLLPAVRPILILASAFQPVLLLPPLVSRLPSRCFSILASSDCAPLPSVPVVGLST